MASIMISSFSIISVKDNGFVNACIGNETGSVIITKINSISSDNHTPGYRSVAHYKGLIETIPGILFKH